jgi:hypothetical protein
MSDTSKRAGRPRMFASNAEKLRVHRAERRARAELLQSALGRLQNALTMAAWVGDELAERCSAVDPVVMLENLTIEFTQRAAAPPPAKPE